jgi:hypothetical protein
MWDLAWVKASVQGHEPPHCFANANYGATRPFFTKAAWVNGMCWAQSSS